MALDLRNWHFLLRRLLSPRSKLFSHSYRILFPITQTRLFFINSELAVFIISRGNGTMRRLVQTRSLDAERGSDELSVILAHILRQPGVLEVLRIARLH